MPWSSRSRSMGCFALYIAAHFERFSGPIQHLRTVLIISKALKMHSEPPQAQRSLRRVFRPGGTFTLRVAMLRGNW